MIRALPACPDNGPATAPGFLMFGVRRDGGSRRSDSSLSPG